MSTFGERLKEIRKSKEMTQEDLALVLGTSKQVISRYEKDLRTPKITIAKEYANRLGVSLLYLLGSSDDIAPSTGWEEPESKEKHFDNIFPIQTKKFPLLGEIACGEPIFANEDRESYIEAGTDIRADFCLKCKGDSMIDARICDGDIVFIRKQESVNNGEIAAVIIENEATLKRVYFYPESGKLVLNPANPAFDPFVYVKDELDQVRILGLAVAFQSDVR